MGKVLRSFVALAIAIAAMVYVLGLKQKDSSPIHSTDPSPPREISVPGARESTPPSESSPPLLTNDSPPPTPSPSERVLDFAPKREAYRNEVDQDPHGTPPSLQHFARGMAAKMETAMRTEAAARDLIPELQDCARNSEVESPRVVCVMNGRRLVQKFPELKSAWNEFEASLPTPLQKRVEQLEQL